MGKDLMTAPYGRFFNLAHNLSKTGHSVHLILISYRRNEIEEKSNGNLRLTSVSINPNPLTALRSINSIIKASNPDWVIGFSDTYYGILAEYFANKYGCKSQIDAYDNYESYIPLLKPLHWLWRRAIARATLVTCAGKSLQDYLGSYLKTGTVHVLPMAADREIFFPRQKKECRKLLGLPEGMKLIGYHGSISQSRDIEKLFSAAKIISVDSANIKFVISGRKDKGISIPEEFIDMGYLPDSKVPLLLNSLDLLIVTNKDNNFGNYSYPVKLYEAMSCNIPVVVSSTESTKWIMKNNPQLLVPVGDVNSLVLKIKEVLEAAQITYEELPGWEEIAGNLERLLNMN